MQLSAVQTIPDTDDTPHWQYNSLFYLFVLKVVGAFLCVNVIFMCYVYYLWFSQSRILSSKEKECGLIRKL